MESVTLKVTMNKLYIRDNGEAPGKGEAKGKSTTA
jgi:hypothetical protein